MWLFPSVSVCKNVNASRDPFRHRGKIHEGIDGAREDVKGRVVEEVDERGYPNTAVTQNPGDETCVCMGQPGVEWIQRGGWGD